MGRSTKCDWRRMVLPTIFRSGRLGSLLDEPGHGMHRRDHWRCRRHGWIISKPHQWSSSRRQIKKLSTLQNRNMAQYTRSNHQGTNQRQADGCLDGRTTSTFQEDAAQVWLARPQRLTQQDHNSTWYPCSPFHSTFESTLRSLEGTKHSVKVLGGRAVTTLQFRPALIDLAYKTSPLLILCHSKGSSPDPSFTRRWF